MKNRKITNRYRLRKEALKLIGDGAKLGLVINRDQRLRKGTLGAFGGGVKTDKNTLIIQSGIEADKLAKEKREARLARKTATN